MSLNKIITINECDECKYVWWYLGTSPCCILENKKPIPIDDDNPIPSWCPLMNAPLAILEAEKKLEMLKGLNVV